MTTRNKRKKKVVVAVSGGFDPIHLGHIRLFRKAKKLGDKLIVIVNGDSWLKRKKGINFMDARARAEVIKEFECVDRVYVHNSTKADVIGALKELKPNVFANGDRRGEKLPEEDICKKLNIKIAYGIGGKKIRSSYEMLENYCKVINKKS